LNLDGLSVIDAHVPPFAAPVLKQALAATSAAGALDVDSNGSDAFFLLTKPHRNLQNYSLQQQMHHLMSFE
jgi:hypothetical protein